MRKYSLVFTLAMLLMLLTFSTAMAAERVPLKIARVPIQVESVMQPSEQTLNQLEKEIDKAAHVPLNGTLKAVEYLDENECAALYADILAGHYGKILKKEAPLKLAELTDADLVIVPHLTGYEEYITHGLFFSHREKLHSFAAVKIEGYDKTADELFKKNVSRSYDDEYTAGGKVEKLAIDAMQSALAEAKIHDRVWEWKNR